MIEQQIEQWSREGQQLDLLLINSPIHDYSRFPRFQSSYSTAVGLLYLATVARNAGFAAEILDAEYRQLSPDQITREIARKRPRFVGFNAFSVNYRIVKLLLASVKDTTITIVGGPHVSSMPLGHLKSEFHSADFIVRRDGECKLLAILKGDDPATIPGILFWRGGELLENKIAEIPIILDELPFPDRTFLPNEPYSREAATWLDISISRGCIFACGFCAGSCKSNGTTYNRRSDLSTFREIDHLVEKYGVAGIEIVDDLPFSSVAQLDSFLARMESRSNKLRLELNLPIAFLRRLNDAHIRALAAAGVKGIAFGVEAGDELLRRSMGKSIKEHDLLQLSKKLAEASIAHKLYFIVGFPNETASQVHQTVNLARELFDQNANGHKGLVRPRLFVFKPFPGSRLWAELLDAGYRESDLLAYDDFQTDVQYFMKHSWGTKTRYSKLEVESLQGTVNKFYNDLYGNEKAHENESARNI